MAAPPGLSKRAAAPMRDGMGSEASQRTAHSTRAKQPLRPETPCKAGTINTKNSKDGGPLPAAQGLGADATVDAETISQ